MRMQQYQHRSLQQQKGVAAVWMGLLLVPIMGVTFWAVEGTRYVQESSRLRDSAEAAAMAVTIEDQPGAARALATKYVENYVRDIKSTNLSAQRFYQAEDRDTGVLEYIQYTVNARTTHDSWFASSFIPSFDKQQELAGRSVARKYPAFLGDNNIDIVFVSDFSGSMKKEWDSSGRRKIDDLKTAIEHISDKILCKKIRQDFVDGEWKDVCDEPGEDTTGDKLLNRVGFVPYNIRTRVIVAGNRANVTSQLSYKNGYKAYLSPYSYNDIDWDYWRTYSAIEVYNCAKDQSDCQNPRSENQNYAKRIHDVLDVYLDTPPTADAYNYVDFPTSVSTMFTDKSGLKSNFFGAADDTRRFYGYGSTISSQFYTIQLSNKLSDLDSIKSMWPDGLTAAFQGILTGFQVLHDGDPNSTDEDEQQAYNKKIKMLMILSDGKENPKNGILEGLVDNGMCDKARAEIPGLYIGVIGIDFSASQQSGFQNCVINPSEDIFDISSLNELIEKIEELIRKGTKTSGITKLY